MAGKENIDLLKKLRKGAKISITKKINKAKRACEDPNSKEFVQNTLESLKLKLEEAKEINHVLKVLAPREPNLIEWENDLETEVVSCEKQIENFFLYDKEIDKKDVVSGKEETEKVQGKMIKIRIADY